RTLARASTTASASRLPSRPANGVPTTVLTAHTPPHNATTTTTSSGNTVTARRAPTPSSTAAPTEHKNTGSDNTAAYTPSCRNPTPLSFAATSVPGPSEPHGTITNPSSPRIAARAREKPNCTSSGTLITAPTPNPVTDSTIGTRPRTINRTARAGSAHTP